jgi:teichuronic acid biosynthesis glycosyltransferase TuaG
MNDLVSVIMPAYNAEKFLPETIDSVLKQSYQNWELIIVDDESNDGTAALIKEYQSKDHRIKYFWQKNGRQGKARNHGIREAKGKYLAFLDADDVWLADKLQRQLKLINDFNVDLVFGYSYLIEGDQRTEKKIGRGKGLYQHNDAISFLVNHDAFIMSTVLCKAEVVLKAGSFIENREIQYCEDWHLYIKLAFNGVSMYTDGEVVSYYRISDMSACSVESEATTKLLKALLDIHKSHPESSILTMEIHKRLRNILFHNSSFKKPFAMQLIDFSFPGSAVKRMLLKTSYSVNQYLYRKLFLWLI